MSTIFTETETSYSINDLIEEFMLSCDDRNERELAFNRLGKVVAIKRRGKTVAYKWVNLPSKKWEGKDEEVEKSWQEKSCLFCGNKKNVEWRDGFLSGSHYVCEGNMGNIGTPCQARVKARVEYVDYQIKTKDWEWVLA
jgi:hypothetical protein